VGKQEGKRPQGRPSVDEGKVRTNLKEIGWRDVDCIHQVQDRG